MKVFLDSIGCRLNQSEIETMARQLLAAGHEIVSSAAEADRVVLNTCAVTKEATKDTKQKVRRFNRANNSAEIIWGPDLETDNTILCRVTVEAP